MHALTFSLFTLRSSGYGSIPKIVETSFRRLCNGKNLDGRRHRPIVLQLQNLESWARQCATVQEHPRISNTNNNPILFQPS